METPRASYDLVTALADYPRRDTSPDRSIVICSHPRSGSTLLGEAVYAAGGLGCPLEYLHRGFRPYFAHRWDAHDLAAFVRALHTFRTDPSGVLSIKLFWRDVESIVDEAKAAGDADLPTVRQGVELDRDDFRAIADRLRAILPHPTFVYLTRRDRVRQAVSAFMASETSVFRDFSPGDVRPRPTVVYKYDAILGQLAAADYGNARWRAFFAALGIEPYRIDYDDLASHYETTVAALLARLGKPGQAPAPRLRRQAAAQSEELVLRFLRDHEAMSATSRSATSTGAEHSAMPSGATIAEQP